MRKAKGPPPTVPDDDIVKIKRAVVEEERDDTVIIFIPSHDGANRKRNDQDQWADAALKLLGQLYGGATAFMALRGVWVDPKTGDELFDEPILIQSLAKRTDVINEMKLIALVQFARRMCRETHQKCVAIVINDAIHYIEN
jgi:hypothetical protein